jgi:hypothetical protein
VETGGVFTKALLDGLRGRADYNDDGVIEFGELALYVEQQVTAGASVVGVRQDPHSYVADAYGGEKILFLLRRRR